MGRCTKTRSDGPTEGFQLRYQIEIDGCYPMHSEATQSALSRALDGDGVRT